MTSNGDESFKRCRSKARVSVSKSRHTGSAAAPSNAQPDAQDKGLQGEAIKRGFLGIDLNFAPPEDGDSESPAGNGGGSGEEFPPPAAVDDDATGSGNERGLNFGGNSDNRNRDVEDEAEQVKTTSTVADSVAEMEEKGNKYLSWNALLKVAETALFEHEEEHRNRKRKASPEAELGGEGQSRMKIDGHSRQSTTAEGNDDSEVAAAAVLATPGVLRSTRGRALAMPSKYRDSVLGSVTVADLPRPSKNGKSATVVSTKRKSR